MNEFESAHRGVLSPELQSGAEPGRKAECRLETRYHPTPPLLTLNSITPNYSLMPYFSIIIPVYNVAPYLRECLDSVLAQTLTDWETICVDDGSTDGSGTILDEYAAKDSRFCVIHQSNAGVSAARNAALDVAQGVYIMFLDADDVWSEHCLETIEEVSARHNDAELIRFKHVSFTDVIRFGPREEPLAIEIIDVSKEIKMTDFFDTLFVGYAYRRSIINSRRFPPYKRGEDRVFLNGIQLFAVTKIHAIDQVLYGYRQRATSQMHTLPSAQVIKDEALHRLDMMTLVDSSGKLVKYEKCGWSTHYFVYDLWINLNLCVAEARKDLLNFWFSLLPRLVSCRRMSRRLRWAYSLSMRLNSRVPVLILGYLPRWYYLHSPTCKAYRLVGRIIKWIKG